MSLKPARDILAYEISFFSNAAMTRGGVVCSYSGVNQASGQALDHSLAIAEYAANPSGRYPLGILGNDVVNQDLTAFPLNRFKDEKQLGDKVTIYRKGWVLTNNLSATVSAANVMPGQPAYLGATGTISNSASAGLPVGTTTLQIGRFLSRPDQDGYAKVQVDL